MSIKAVVFDIGQTLVYYPVPLNWSALYRPAFESIAEKLGLDLSESEYAHIGAVLTKYNTRINPRTEEVSSDMIFREIIAGTDIPEELTEKIKEGFYGYFRRDVCVYPEAEKTLKGLRAMGIITATLSDVAYGMDNKYALADIADVAEYIDIPFTSNDAGVRKPDSRGLTMLAEKTGILPSEMIFVGDERKDIECAANAGAVSVLIDRTEEDKRFGQDYTIKALNELLSVVPRINARQG